MKKALLSISIALLCWNCQNTPQNGTDVQEINLSGKVVLTDSMLDICTPESVQLIDTLLVTRDIDGDKLIDVWGKNSGKHLNSFANRGMGPTELRRIDSFTADDTEQAIYFYSSDNQKLFKVAYADLLKENPPLQEVHHWDFGDPSPFALNETYKMGKYYVGANITDTTMFVVKESSGTIKTFGKVPDKKHVSPDMTDMSNAQLYTMNIAVSPDHQKIAGSTHLADMLVIMKVDNGKFPIDMKVNAYPNDIYAMPIGNGEVQGLCTEKTKNYYIDITTSDDYIYAIWYGDVFIPDGDYLTSNIVRVFNWEGEECYRLVLDKGIFNLTVSNDNKTLYAISNKVEGFAIIKYEMELP